MNMRRLIPVAMLGLSLLPLFGQTNAVQNEEQVAFYFTIVERGSAEYESVGVSLQSAVDIVSGTPLFREMVPGMGVAPLVPMIDDAFLVGVFVYPGRSTYPVAVVPVTGESGTVVVSRDNALTTEDGTVVTVRPWQIQLSGEPIVLDNRYLDWEPVPALARFSRRVEPAEFVLETEHSRTTAPIQDALFWGVGGTRLNTLKAVQSDRAVYLHASTHEQMSTGMSLLFFLYADRGVEAPAITFEVPITGTSGWVLLWQPGEVEPVVVGNYIRDSFMLEAMIRFDRLPGSLPALDERNAAVEVSTMFSGSGRHEEFYHSRFYVSSILKSQPVGLR